MGRNLELFQHLALSPGGGLAHPALCIARFEYPELDLSRYLEWFEKEGRQLAVACSPSDAVADRLRAVNQFVYERNGFRPNLEDYDDPRNSFLNDVIERRLGIPISLAVVYIELASYAGLELKGVGFPGHFLVRVQPGMFVDPFHFGEILERGDCERLFQAATGGQVPFRDNYLKPASKTEVLARMLANLRNIFIKQEKLERAVEILNWAVAIQPDTPIHYRDRGILLARLECPHAAVKDLEHYLSCSVSRSERAEIQKLLVSLRGSKTVVH